EAVARWSVGGLFLEGLAARDFDRLAESLDSEVRFRRLLPPGPSEVKGAEVVAAEFRSWFGEADDFAVVDATVGQVGNRVHLAWRLRVRPAPFGIGDGWHVIEQQAYADVGDRIEAPDLPCSGFTPETGDTQAA